jgi:O-antigen ligase
MALVLFVILLYPAGLTESRTAKMALVAGAGVMAMAHLLPRVTPRLLAVFPFALLGWPFAAAWTFRTHADFVDHLPFSWRHRIEIWDYLSYRIIERPWFGWGLGTTSKLDFHSPNSEMYHYATQAAPHAHNFITELWVETGVPGLALGTLFLLFTLRKASTLRVDLRPFALGSWMAAIVVSLVGFNWWTDALWAAFALSAFVFGGLNQSVSIGGNEDGACESALGKQRGACL